MDQGLISYGGVILDSEDHRVNSLDFKANCTAWNSYQELAISKYLLCLSARMSWCLRIMTCSVLIADLLFLAVPFFLKLKLLAPSGLHCTPETDTDDTDWHRLILLTDKRLISLAHRFEKDSGRGSTVHQHISYQKYTMCHQSSHLMTCPKRKMLQTRFSIKLKKLPGIPAKSTQISWALFVANCKFATVCISFVHDPSMVQTVCASCFTKKLDIESAW